MAVVGNDAIGEHRYIPSETVDLLMNAGSKLPAGLWLRVVHGLSLHAIRGIVIDGDGAAQSGFNVKYLLPVNSGRSAGQHSR